MINLVMIQNVEKVVPREIITWEKYWGLMKMYMICRIHIHQKNNVIQEKQQNIYKRLLPWLFFFIRCYFVLFQDPDGLYWCSTRVNPKTRVHIGGKGHWGYCQPDCDEKPIVKEVEVISIYIYYTKL